MSAQYSVEGGILWTGPGEPFAEASVSGVRPLGPTFYIGTRVSYATALFDVSYDLDPTSPFPPVTADQFLTLGLLAGADLDAEGIGLRLAAGPAYVRTAQSYGSDVDEIGGAVEVAVGTRQLLSFLDLEAGLHLTRTRTNDQRGVRLGARFHL